MCRALIYLGTPILLEDLLYKPDSSLVIQSYNPKLMTEVRQNLGGFGMVAWDDASHNSGMPYLYRTHLLPFYDQNLVNLSQKIKAKCLIAHIRGVDYHSKAAVSNENVHPFQYDNTNLAFAHNGDLAGFEKIRFDLATYMKPEFRIRIHGTTDTEWMYALFLSMLPSQEQHSEEEIHEAICKTLDVIRTVRKKHKVFYSSSLNFFISDGDIVFANRFTLDYGHYPPNEPDTLRGYTSLWYTFGEEYGFFENEYRMRGWKKRNSIIIASEPLTSDYTSWVEVPEYSFISASLKKGEVSIKSSNMDP